MKYGFQLGRKNTLCLAELLEKFDKNSLISKSKDFAIFDMDNLQAKIIQNHLGGTIKIIEIIKDFPLTSNTQAEQKISTITEQILAENFKDHSGKIPFSINFFPQKTYYKINIKNLLNFSKKILKSLNLNSRFVNKDFRKNPKPSTIYKSQTSTKGLDLNIIEINKHFFIGKTVAIQNINDYSKRDFEKPVRDAKIGMLPPKLSQIMINLAGKTETIYDPFCGTGGILMEALLMGKSALGSDIEPRMVEASQKNCQWLINNFKNQTEEKNFPWKFSVFQKDARLINKNSTTEKISAIVTEGYLGPPKTKSPSPEEKEKTFRELANLHLNWLKATNPLLKKGARVVMCVTAYISPKSIDHLPKFEQIAQTAGYKIIGTYTYDREDQIVARDIKVLEKL